MKRSAEPLLDDVSPNPAKVARVDTLQQLFNKEDKDEIIDELHQMVVEDHFTFIDLFYQVQEGPNKGTSVWWWLAKAVVDGKPEAFLAVWDKYKEKSQLLEGLLERCKGISALWLLAGSVSHHKEVFLDVWNKYKDDPALQSQLLEGLLAQATQEGEHKGTSALWMLAAGVATRKPEAFFAVWNTYKDNPVLQAQLLEGILAQQKAEDKGKSAILLLVHGVFIGMREAFFAVWDKCKDNQVLQSQLLEGLLAQVQEGEHKGKSALWWLAAGVSHGKKPEAFFAFWNKYKDNPVLQAHLLEGLLAQAQEGKEKGKSALWMLAAGVATGKPEAFLAVWDTYKDNPVLQAQLLEGILAHQKAGDKGKSAISLLAYGVSIGKPEAFFAVWDKCKDSQALQQLIERLLAQIQEGEHKGKSALWMLALGVVNDKPEAFLAIWDKYKDNPALQSHLLEGLLAQVQAGEDKGKSALSLLIIKNENGRVRQILKDIFALLPGCIAVDNPDIKKLIDLKIVTSELIHARNAFFTALESAKKQSALTKEGIESLMELADEAQQQGYVNAFYELGHFIDFFEQKEGDLLAPVADEVYERVSPLSPNYEWACIRCAENKFNLARFDAEQRNTLLCDSLRMASDIKEANARLNIIRQVASLYILGTNYLRSQLPIHDDQLLLMQDKKNIEHYFGYFDEVKKIVEGQKDINKQIEAVKALNVVFSLQQSNSVLRFSAAPMASPEISGSSIEPPKMKLTSYL